VSSGVDRTVFCVSDHTGLTAETFAHSLLTRFPGVAPHYETRPFVDTVEKVEQVVDEIDAVAALGPRPIVFSTVSEAALLSRLERANGLVLSMFGAFVEELAREFRVEPSQVVGAYHGMRDTALYQVRLDAVDFALTTDDGLGLEHYRDAEVIVLGVSRVGKTPTSLYLAMQYGIRAANYPLTLDGKQGPGLPPAVAGFQDRLHGLTIDPIRLYQIRQKRRPDSAYASLERCAEDVERVERMFRAERIPVTDTTARSIEEIAATIIEGSHLIRHLD
jgi:regulator of PEP synthase PpsR (kinase-PPPase family)